MNPRMAELQHAIETFRGLVQGIVADGVVSLDEAQRLLEWLAEHPDLAGVYPLSEAADRAQQIVDAGRVDTEDAEDFIRFTASVCRYANTGEPIVTTDIAELRGFLEGIAADRVINAEELDALRRWLERHGDVIDTWPYNKTAETIEGILADGIVTREEQTSFLTFAQEVVAWVGAGTDDTPTTEVARPT